MIVNEIIKVLPNSKIIHCYRDSRDNCFSIFKNHFTSGNLNFAYDISEIVDFYNLDLDKNFFFLVSKVQLSLLMQN